MALTQYETARLRWIWSELARNALIVSYDHMAEPEGFRARAADATKWLSPLEDYADAFVLFAFSRLAASWCRAKVGTLKDRAPALRELAQLVLRILGDAPKPAAAPEPPPRLPFRLDIDG